MTRSPIDMEGGGEIGIDIGSPQICLFKKSQEFLIVFRIDLPWADKAGRDCRVLESNILILQEKVLKLKDFVVLCLRSPTSLWQNWLHHFKSLCPFLYGMLSLGLSGPINEWPSALAFSWNLSCREVESSSAFHQGLTIIWTSRFFKNVHYYIPSS